jgi:hypothetical protein
MKSVPKYYFSQSFFADYNVHKVWSKDVKYDLELTNINFKENTIIGFEIFKFLFLELLILFSNVRIPIKLEPDLKVIVSRDFVVCFLVSFDRSYISTHQERVLLLLKFVFVSNFLIFVSGRGEPQKENGA